MEALYRLKEQAAKKAGLLHLPFVIGLSFVMAGLVPAIHVFTLGLSREDVDARHKAGHDGCEARRTHKQ